MFTKEKFIRWIQLSYKTPEHYGGWELMWKPECVPHGENLINKEEELKQLNKEMVETYPFLLPRNRWTDKVSEDYDYSYNEWEAIDLGWQIAFGWDLLNKLAVAVNNLEYPEEFRITQIKEKFGELRIYCCGSREIYQLIDDYTALSRKICIVCGKPADVATTGWFSFYCNDCAKRLDLKDTKPIAEFERWWNGENEIDE